MIVTIKPSKAYGRIEAPPSKSMAHRLLICAGCAGGTSVISNVDLSEDILATLDCLRALGAQISYENKNMTVRGVDVRNIPHPAELPCRECGSTLRFMIPLCLLSGQKNRLTGSERLFSRPLDIYRDICRDQGLLFEKQGKVLNAGGFSSQENSLHKDNPSARESKLNSGGTSVKENRPDSDGRLAPGDYVIPGNISSQFISGLLFALPMLEGDSTIRLLPPVESRPYIDMTLQALRLFGITGITIEWTGSREAAEGTVSVNPLPGEPKQARLSSPLPGESKLKEPLPAGPFRFEREKAVPAGSLLLRIPGGQKYCPRDLRVEGDYSNAAFFDALNVLGGNVRVEGLEEESLQGDRIYRPYFAQLRESFAEINLADCPDLGPVLMALAAACHGGKFTGTRRLKIKESDRGAAMQQELQKMNCRVKTAENEILVFPGICRPRQMLDGHNDHRIVMALSVLLTMTGGSIRGAQAVSKSLPDFFEKLYSLGVELTIDRQ